MSAPRSKDREGFQTGHEAQKAWRGGEPPLSGPLSPFNNIHKSCSMLHSAQSASNVVPIEPLKNLSDTLAKHQQAMGLHQLLWNIFTTLLEPRISLWIGAIACPFPTTITTPTTRISKLMLDLDANPCRPHRTNSSGNLSAFKSEDGDDSSINRALKWAVYAFSVRWLQPTDNKQSQDSGSLSEFKSRKKELSKNLWAQARRQISTVMSRPSFRSILALYLFANIPKSSREDGENLEELCLETSSRHHHYLHSRAQISFTSHDPVASLVNNTTFSRTAVTLEQEKTASNAERREYQSMTNHAFWFGIISDTTRALTRCRPSILLPGWNSQAKVWSAIRERTQAFKSQFDSLRQSRTPISDADVLVILQHAFAFKTLVWAAIIRVQDALVYQISGTSLAEAVDVVRKESNNFEETFGQLLCLCQRDFMLLNRETQICYALLAIHFQVGNLILVDALPPTFVFIDQNFSPYDMRLCACRSIVNALSLALQAPCSKTNGWPGSQTLLLDPHPDHMANAIIRTGSSLCLLYTMQKLTQENVNAMFAVVIASLEVLSEVSHIASEAIPLLKQKLAQSGIHQAACLGDDTVQHASISKPSLVDFDAEAVRELEQQALDQLLIDLPVAGSDDSSGSDYLQYEMEPFDLYNQSPEWISEDYLHNYPEEST